MFQLFAFRRRLMAMSRTVAILTAVGVSVATSCGWGLAEETGATATTDAANEPVVLEVIRERYPNGTVKIEREVTMDPEGNYVNHGAWRMWDEASKLVSEGRYEMGRRSGRWSRWCARDEAAVLKHRPFDEFEAPFVSSATFTAGELDGEWTIVDAKDRKCSCVAFRNGKRNGTATLWRPDGKICREATFRNGVAVGDVRECNADGRLLTIASYIDGHQMVNKVTNFPGTDKKKSEAGYLAAAVTEATPDDFEQLRFAEYVAKGEAERHGAWKSWYPNGQVESEGVYQFDRENGKFTWWHANGQTAVEGQFVDGQEDGTWVWWHANGQKSGHGSYHYGKLVGTWRGWAEDGRLVRRDEYGDGQMLSQAEPPMPHEAAPPAASIFR